MMLHVVDFRKDTNFLPHFLFSMLFLRVVVVNFEFSMRFENVYQQGLLIRIYMWTAKLTLATHAGLGPPPRMQAWLLPAGMQQASPSQPQRWPLTSHGAWTQEKTGEPLPARRPPVAAKAQSPAGRREEFSDAERDRRRPRSVTIGGPGAPRRQPRLPGRCNSLPWGTWRREEQGGGTKAHALQSAL